MPMKQILKWLICLVLILALLPSAALAGLLEAEPMETTEATGIPAIAPEPTIIPTTWRMPKTFRATKGGTYQLVEVRPVDRSLPTVYAQSSRPDIASVNDRGEITAKEIGKTTITVKNHNGKPMKCTVEVVRNAISRKNPAKGSPGEVVTSTKSLSYDDGKLKIEIYILNRTGTTIRKAEGLTLQLKQGETVLVEKQLPTWKVKKGFKSGAKKVYKVSLKREELAEFTNEPLDLGSGEYEAVIVGWNGESVETTAAERPPDEAETMTNATIADQPDVANTEPVEWAGQN